MSSSGKQQQEIAVSGKEAGNRLDRVLAERSELSRTRLKSLILAGEVKVGGRTVRDPSHKVGAGDVIVVNVPEPEAPKPTGEDIPLKVVFEDDEIIVIDKPAGLVVHPAAGHASGTLVNALIAHCGDSLSGIGGVKRPGIVHRLDKDTTGLMVVAKTDRAHQALAAQFADHGRTGPLKRAYLAFAWGAPRGAKGTVDAPLGRHPKSRDKIAIRKDGRHAITHWQVLERYVLERYPGPGASKGAGKGSLGKVLAPVASLIECRLETGRTHQIRVHLAHIGHPLLGDPVYGPGFRTKAARLPPEPRAALEGLGRQALHAYLLAVQHPTTGQQLEFRSELPVDLARLHHSLVTSAADATNPASIRPKKPSRTKG